MVLVGGDRWEEGGGEASWMGGMFCGGLVGLGLRKGVLRLSRWMGVAELTLLLGA
jgi:hypothetical protein